MAADYLISTKGPEKTLFKRIVSNITIHYFSSFDEVCPVLNCNYVELHTIITKCQKYWGQIAT